MIPLKFNFAVCLKSNKNVDNLLFHSPFAVLNFF